MSAARQEGPGFLIKHQDWCEGELGHDGDCHTATRLARLQAFAEAVRDEFECVTEPVLCADPEDCWHCAAAQALERAGV